MTSYIMTIDDEQRSLISCTRDDSDECYKTFAYAIEKGITAEHFDEEAYQIYWEALIECEKEGDLFYYSAFQKRPNFQRDYPWFFEEVIQAHDLSTFHKGKQAVDALVKQKKLKDLERIGHTLELTVKDSDINSDPTAIASKFEKEIQEIIKPDSSNLVSSKEVTDSTIAEIKKCLEEGPARIQPHLPWLKKCLRGGFKDGHVIAVAARPSVGKTTIALNWVYHEALRGKKSLFFSLEMKAEALWEKLGLIRSKTDHGLDYRTDCKETNARNAGELIKNIEECKDLPIFIDDYGASTISQIRASARIMHRKHNLDCVVIDYLGLIRPEDPKMPREQQVADMSRQCKHLAKEIDRPVFVICQLNRDSVKNGSEPQLHNLRESGQIEQDADVAILLHRNLLGQDKEDVKVIVAKQRFGGTGHSRDLIKFKANSQRFVQEVPARLNDGFKEVNYDDEELRI